MPTAVWTGTLSFGLVSVPVRLFPATEPKDVRFHQYDREGRRLRYRRVVEEPAPPIDTPSGRDDAVDVEPPTDRGGSSTTEGPDGGAVADRAGSPRTTAGAGPAVRDVSWDEVVLGRETDTGDTVFVEREEIERLRPRRSATIDIEDFVDLDDIDPVYFEKTYHAMPRTAGDAKPYVLLLRAMQRTSRVGIGRFVLRTKPHLVAVRPMRDVLAIETLYFGDEVRDPATVAPVALEGVPVNERELALAEQLIGMLRAEWDPAAYADTYRQELLDLLASKTSVAPPEEERPAASATVDALMAALRDSVEAAKRARASDDAETRAG